MKKTSINYNGDTYIVKSKYDYDLYEVKLNRDKEIERLNNIINRLEEFIEKEIELYTIELTEKNTNALSYSLPIKGAYKEIYNVLQELKGDGSDD